MSGVFGPVAQIQVPDFGASLARAQGLQANRLAMLAQQRAMERDDRLTQFFDQNAAGFASPDAGKRMNLLAMLAGQGGQGAAMALPMLGQERQRQELRAIMNDEPIAGAPAQPMASAQPAGGGSYIDRLVGMESGGNPTARNPRSTATGATQFIEGTWRQFAQANPDLFRGMSDQQILDARNDPNLSRRAAEWYRDQNVRYLGALGLPTDDTSAALAHRFGPQGAASLLRAAPDTPIAQIVGEQVMRANPDLAGRTVAQVTGDYARRFGRAQGDTTPATTPAQAGAPQAANNDARIAVLQRRAERLAAAGYQQEAQTTLALIQSLRRGEAARPVEIADPTSPTGRRLVQPQEAYGQPAPGPADRNAQFVDLGEDGPQGAGRYRVNQDGTFTRVAAVPTQSDPTSAPFNRENQLRDEFTRLTGDFRVVQTAYQNIRTAGASQTGAGDMSMLYSFVKLLDPQSVVRESEFAAAAASGSFGERIQGAVQRILNGERLPDSLRESFLDEARNLFNSQRRNFDRTSETYRDLARRNNLNPENIVLPFGDDDIARGAAQPPRPPGGGGNSGNNGGASGAQGGNAAGRNALPRPATPGDAMRLPPGTRFIDPEGVERVRP